MKKIKDYQRKVSDIRDLATRYSADLDFENPTYQSESIQRQQVVEWVQTYNDVIKEILRLRVAIQRTNIVTPVTIELGDKAVTKTIAEWIHRRRDLATLQSQIYTSMQSKANGMRTGRAVSSAGEERDIKVRRYFDPADFDKQIEALRSEPMTIDATLEVVNAITDLVEA